MKKILTAHQVLRAYNLNPHLTGGFSEDFGKRLFALDRHQREPKLSQFNYTFLNHQKNIQQTIHGGALAAMVDVSTTIGILRMTPHRTISISLSIQYLNVIKMQEEVEIDTQVTKIGRNIVFAECRMFTNPQSKKKLVCKGQHIKSIMQQTFNFMQHLT